MLSLMPNLFMLPLVILIVNLAFDVRGFCQFFLLPLQSVTHPNAPHLFAYHFSIAFSITLVISECENWVLSTLSPFHAMTVLNLDLMLNCEFSYWFSHFLFSSVMHGKWTNWIQTKRHCGDYETILHIENRLNFLFLFPQLFPYTERERKMDTKDKNRIRKKIIFCIHWPNISSKWFVDAIKIGKNETTIKSWSDKLSWCHSGYLIWV